MHRRRGGAIPERGRSGGGEAGAGEAFEPALVFGGEEGGGGVGEVVVGDAVVAAHGFEVWIGFTVVGAVEERMSGGGVVEAGPADFFGERVWEEVRAVWCFVVTEAGDWVSGEPFEGGGDGGDGIRC